MNPTLTKIKRLVLAGRIFWTLQAEVQMSEAGLDRQAVVEAILGAQFLQSKRSVSIRRQSSAERVHIIKGFSFDGVFVYVKGIIRKVNGEEQFYIVVSAKRAD